MGSFIGCTASHLSEKQRFTWEVFHSCTIYGNHLHCTVAVRPVLPHQLRGRRLLSPAAQFFVSTHPHNEPTISQFIPSCNRPSSIPKKIHYTILTIRFHKIPPNSISSIQLRAISTFSSRSQIPIHQPRGTCALAVPGSSWPL